MANTFAAPRGAAYAETRRHELRKSRMLMIDGNLAVNTRNAEAGASARVYRDGYWGFASVSQPPE
jgi:TldD protein